MRRLLTALILVLGSAAPTWSASQAWDIDPAHTGVQFKVRHLMVSSVRGNFEKVAGTIVFDGKDVSLASADVTIDAASINTRDAKRDAHLRSPDFLDVAKFPTIVFKSRTARKAEDGRIRLTGDLTIRGVTREVVLDVESSADPVKDPWGKVRIGAAASTTINRRDFGLTWNKALETGGVLVGDEVAISIDIEIIMREG